MCRHAGGMLHDNFVSMLVGVAFQAWPGLGFVLATNHQHVYRLCVDRPLLLFCVHVFCVPTGARGCTPLLPLPC